MRKILLFAILFSTSAYAQLYKCLDDDGAVTYLSKPCPSNLRESPLELIDSSNHGYGYGGALVQSPDLRQRENTNTGAATRTYQQSAKEAQLASKEASEKRLRESNCSNSRDRIAYYHALMRKGYSARQGEYYNEKLREYKKQRDDNCD